MEQSPFIVNVADVLRHDGASRQMRVEAPVAWRLELSEVLPEPPLIADLEASRVGGGVLFRGTVTAAVRHTCHRCLEPDDAEITVELAQLYADSATRDADEDDYALDGEFADLEPLLRDEVLLAMPILPTCPDGCDPELVAGAETGLNTASPAEDTSGSSPFAVLKDLLGE